MDKVCSLNFLGEMEFYHLNKHLTKSYHESQESKMIPLLMNSISMKGVLVIMNTVTTVSARLVVFSLALDMYRLSAFLGRLTLIEVRVLVVCNKNIC